MTTSTEPSPATPSSPSAPAKPREWMPRIWEGSDFFGWMRLLIRNRFAVDWPFLYIAVIITFVSFFHTLLRYLQTLWYGSRIRATKITEAPIFIIGHWRTGTTLLHELLILDPRHAFPNTYQCFEPNHFLLTESIVTRWMNFLMPSRRPMDNMAAGWKRPQEDEFALCMMGQPSPYLTIAFPNRPPLGTEFLDMQGVPPKALASWQSALYGFMQRLTFKDPRRLVLKSPPHTARIPALLEIFPDARFVHIMRNPYVVFPSTVNLWKTFYQTHGLQTPTYEGLEEQVLTTFVRMYEGLEHGRPQVDPSRFYELRYEELVKNPVSEMQKLYDHLGLDGFDEMLPRLQEYQAKNANYETNRYQMSPERRVLIKERWGAVIRKYGYEEPAVS